jgi:phage shock protein A
MRFVELLALRVVLWLGLPLLLVVLVVGPRRFWRALQRSWNWLWDKRLEPEEVLTRIVHQHQEHVKALQSALAQAEAAEQDIGRNMSCSEKNCAKLENEARQLAQQADDLGARAALYKLNLERRAVETFREQRERQQAHIRDGRRRLYLLELQLRQYEVGRSILLSQLAEAKTVEQQLDIANRFDPFSAVANWEKAEGAVQEKALTARAVERVLADTADLPMAGSAMPIDEAGLDAQLKALKAGLQPAKAKNEDHSARHEGHHHERVD